MHIKVFVGKPAGAILVRKVWQEGQEEQKEGKGRNQPGCTALPTSIFNLVNVSP